MAKECKQTNCQYYYNGRGCLSCIHNPDTHVYKLQKQIDQLQAENKLLRERIETAVEYLPECPDKALSFLKPALQEKPK